jgi:hypothetical protein
MRSRLIAVAAMIAAIAAAGLTGLSAHAGQCDGDVGAIYLFSNKSYPENPVSSGTPSFQSKAIGCQLGGDPNTNYIYPGSDQVSVRFTQDLKVPALKARLEGLGLKIEIDLKRSPLVSGTAYAWDSKSVPIDPTKTGTLKVTVLLPDGPVSDTYRTVGS